MQRETYILMFTPYKGKAIKGSEVSNLGGRSYYINLLDLEGNEIELPKEGFVAKAREE